MKPVDCNLILGDCLEKMKDIPTGSIDLILTDPPYGTTACKWDSVIPFEPMWQQIWRVLKPNGACVLFGREPFSSNLRLSCAKFYKYDWIWEKNIPSNIACANYEPMRYTELISVFYQAKPLFNKQLIPRDEKGIKRIAFAKENNLSFKCTPSLVSNASSSEIDPERYNTFFKNPSNIIKFQVDKGKKRFHPTQKPVELLEYLIKTYTLEGETVLDFTMGSGSTVVAAKNLNRNFIGIEKDEKYFRIAIERINNVTGGM